MVPLRRTARDYSMKRKRRRKKRRKRNNGSNAKKMREWKRKWGKRKGRWSGKWCAVSRCLSVRETEKKIQTRKLKSNLRCKCGKMNDTQI